MYFGRCYEQFRDIFIPSPVIIEISILVDGRRSAVAVFIGPVEIPDAMVCRARWVQSFQRANETAEQDTVFTLDAVVIQEGQLANFAVMRASRHETASDQAEAIGELLDSVSRARSYTEPTEISGEFVRIVAEETVRATKPAIDLPLPPTKPVASRTSRARRVIA